MFASSLLAATLTATPTAPPEVPAPDVRENVKKALKWLAGRQNKDGTWTGNNNAFRTLTTSYCGLALLMEGSTLGEGAYSENLRRAVAWFEKVAQRSGALFPADDPNEQGQQMHNHAAALLFLASAYDSDDDPARRQRLGKLLDPAVKYAVDGQTSRGGWPSVRGRDGYDFDDTMSSVFVLQALKAAEKAGAKVPGAALDRAAKYLADATNPEGGVVFTLSNGVRPRGGDGQTLPTAGAAAVFVHAERKPATLAKWVSYSQKNMPYLPRGGQGPRPQLNNSFTLQHHLVVARVARGLGGGGHRALDPAAREADLLAWSAHREALFKYLQATQAADGSWLDQFIGSSYSTALALIMLQMDNNHLPAFAG
jgi:hypothetical protein